jgi:hypothetical protein
LRFGERHIAVSRSGATLCFVQMPEVKNTPVASSPGGVIDFLLGRGGCRPLSRPPSVPDVPAEPEPIRRKPLFKLSLGGQIALMAVLASVLVGLVFRQVNAPPPDGYAYVSDAAKLKSLHERFNGRYGSGVVPDTLSFVVNGNQLDILANAGTTPLMEKSERVRYAMRGATVALIGRDGDILEFDPDGNLLFGELSTPRN